MNKTCYVCKETKTLDLFHKNKLSKDGRQSRCAKCATEQNKARYVGIRDNRVEYQKKYDSRQDVKTRSKMLYIIRTYGVEESVALELMSRTICEICGREGIQMHIDHCHTTGKIRGALCSNCNMSIGGFKESISSLEKAIKYLKAHGGIA